MVVAREKTPLDKTSNPRRGDHPGLLAQRFSLRKTKTPSDQKEDPSSVRNDALQNVIDALSRAAPVYKPAFELWERSFESTPENRKRRLDVAFNNPQRVIVGLGAGGVIETGVSLLHTYGVPYLPGSSIKGMTSSYCHNYYGSSNASFRAAIERKVENRTERSPQGEVHRLIFGSKEESGLVVFHDAWICQSDARSSLQPDVMTPHHDVYNGGGGGSPSDFDSPTPVSFLSVVGKFSVYLTIEEQIDDRSAEVALNFAARLVSEAFQKQGIGGKTSSGYGFAEVSEQTV